VDIKYCRLKYNYYVIFASNTVKTLVSKQQIPEFMLIYKSVMATTLVRKTELITALIPGAPAVTNRAENKRK